MLKINSYIQLQDKRKHATFQNLQQESEFDMQITTYLLKENVHRNVAKWSVEMHQDIWESSTLTITSGKKK